MKILLKFIIIIFFTANITLANNIYDKIDIIKISILDNKKNLKNLAKKYKIEQNPIVKENLDKMNNLLKIIESTKWKSLTYKNQEIILNYLNENLDKINESSKIILKKWKEKLEKNLEFKKIIYSNIWKDISEKVNFLIKKIYLSTEINKKFYLNQKEKNIKKLLENISQNTLKLRNFEKIFFENEEIMKEEFKKIFINIRENFKILKEKIKDL